MASEEEEFVYSAGELDDEEEMDEVDWEDVDTLQSTVAPQVCQSVHPVEIQETIAQDTDDDDVNEDTTELASNLRQIDWEKVNHALEQQEEEEKHAASSACKRRRTPLRLTKGEKEHEKMLHQIHLLLLLATRIKWIRSSQSQLLQGLLLSLTAKSDVDFFVEIKDQPLSYSLALLVRWFNHEFQLVEEKETLSGEMVTESSLMNAFFARAGRDYELPLLFAALCGALQLHYRLTCALDPLQVQRGKAFESLFRQRPSKRRRSQKVANALLKKKMVLNGSEEEKEEVDKERDPESTETLDRVLWLWCEVLDEKSTRWIHVDVVRRLVDRPHEVEVLRGRMARFSYVISIQDDGQLVDVTSRYTMQWSKSLPLRLADSWLEQVLERYNEDTVDEHSVTSTTQGAVDMNIALMNEKKELDRLKLGEGMPSSVEGFRKHPIYCLERHLGQFECLHPRKIVGVFNGQSVFLRQHVQRLHSAFQWRRLGRVVNEGEREKPAKWLQRGGSSSSNQDDHDNDDEESDHDVVIKEDHRPLPLALFGRWQTSEFEPLSMINGRIPRNKYGNLEIWSPAHVPRGAVHVQLSRIDTIAEALGIDYAHAVVGFKLCHGQMRPKVNGIIVAQTNQDLLLEAHVEKQDATIQKAMAHNQKLVRKRWQNLTKRLLLRQRLEDDYGAV
ncbi:unnamed protein product [Peronospora belbahrii]|uniref:Rad4 beta-hairpin domain-containing protein n=1 Tax=Peronospora belbahrii TaxID=622444 RepID=A0AAU9L3S5_9STRA|nr:unnamed protein product [Peronospora belbahrii]